MINFHLPGFYLNFKLNKIFLEYFLTHKNEFYDDINIVSFYDSFPGCAWNGGRTIHMIYDLPTSANIKNTIQFFNNYNIPCRFTFTNTQLEEKDLEDIVGNTILKLCDNGMNQVLINSSILENKIRKEYPNYKIISSTTKNIKNIEIFNKDLENENYLLAVLDIKFNNNFSLLEKISNKEKCEILLNDPCHFDCQARKAHYDFCSLVNKGLADPENFSCIHPEVQHQCFYELINNNPSHIKVEDLYTKYVNMGFKHFKLSGRDEPAVLLLEEYIYYMVKPEYHLIVRNKILKELC